MSNAQHVATKDCFQLQIAWVLIEEKVWVKMDPTSHKLDQLAGINIGYVYIFVYILYTTYI